MGLIKGFVKRVEDPSAPGEVVTIRMLSYFELQSAADAALDKMRARVKGLAEMADAIASAAPADLAAARERAEASKQGEADPLIGLDELTLLKLGVLEWTYKDEKGAPIPLDVTLFDNRTAPFVAREIARFSNPPADDVGKASSPSTAT